VTRDGSGPALVWLHGFTQTRNSARRFRSILTKDYEVLTLDLPGHGTAARVSASLEATAALVGEALEGRRVDLGGYSMGGRVALLVALAHPELVGRLVVVSATAGIPDPAQRAARRRRDEDLAERIERVGADAFLDEWLAQPLFASLAPDPLERAARSHDAAGLADSLRRCGTGNQPWLGEALRGVAAETLVLAGALDDKFVAPPRVGHPPRPLRAARRARPRRAPRGPRRRRGPRARLLVQRQPQYTFVASRIASTTPRASWARDESRNKASSSRPRSVEKARRSAGV
jgi:2-succinyl-6-hydroxy-2,4-cyclohexadiene-1-carboxylate synthase